ncbi:MAG: dienelactone hydrolase family protein [Bryobacteraceae bacterium]
MREEFGTPHTKDEKIESLIHQYVDGGLHRRDLIKRLARLTGGSAGALAALETAGLAQVAAPACADDVKVAEDDPAIEWNDVAYPSEAGSTQALMAWPRGLRDPQPAVMVVHENRGLVEHIRDVTRRMAKAGFVALGVDLLSRQGGTGAFADDTARTQAYGRTIQAERYNDMFSGIEFLQKQEMVIWDRIGAIGFCAGGGNIFYGAYNEMPLQAAVPFYGTPPNPLPTPSPVTTPMLCVFSETDTRQAAIIPSLVQSLVAAKVTFGVHLFKGTGHGFHNDTSPIYNKPAACDAWAKAVDFLNTHLRAPRTV